MKTRVRAGIIILVVLVTLTIVVVNHLRSSTYVHLHAEYDVHHKNGAQLSIYKSVDDNVVLYKLDRSGGFNEYRSDGEWVYVGPCTYIGTLYMGEDIQDNRKPRQLSSFPNAIEEKAANPVYGED